MNKYAKAIIAAVVTLAAWGAAALADGHVGPAEWAQLLGVVAATVGVYTVPNASPAPPASINTPEANTVTTALPGA